MVRAGLRTFLGLQPDMEVVGEAGSGEQALALVPRLGPEIVLLDLVLPGMSGLDVVRRAAYQNLGGLAQEIEASAAYAQHAGGGATRPEARDSNPPSPAFASAMAG